MGKPFSLRLDEGTLARLTRRSDRASLPPRTLAQRYVEEGLRNDEHPLIRFVDGPAGRRAALLGTGLDVWEVIATVRDNDGDPREAATYLGISNHLVDAAVTYYGAFGDEVDAWIEANAEVADEAHRGWLQGRRAISR